MSGYRSEDYPLSFLETQIMETERKALKRNFQSFCVRAFNLRSCHLRPRPSMHTHNRDIEKTSGQAAQFNMWTLWSMDRTSAQPQVNLSLLHSNEIPASVQSHACLVLKQPKPRAKCRLYKPSLSHNKCITLWSQNYRILLPIFPTHTVCPADPKYGSSPVFKQLT